MQFTAFRNQWPNIKLINQTSKFIDRDGPRYDVHDVFLLIKISLV